MQAAIPLYAIIEVNGEADAQLAKKAIETFLNQYNVKMLLQSAGLRVQELTVADPYPVQAQVAYQPNGR